MSAAWNDSLGNLVESDREKATKFMERWGYAQNGTYVYDNLKSDAILPKAAMAVIHEWILEFSNWKPSEDFSDAFKKLCRGDLETGKGSLQLLGPTIRVITVLPDQRLGHVINCPGELIAVLNFQMNSHGRVEGDPILPSGHSSVQAKPTLKQAIETSIAHKDFNKLDFPGDYWISEHIQWVTFTTECHDGTEFLSVDPLSFAAGQSAAFIRACLGLSYKNKEDGDIHRKELWMLTYPRKMVKELHCPTCGDAELDSQFRAQTSSTENFGMTRATPEAVSLTNDHKGRPQSVHDGKVKFSKDIEWFCVDGA